MHLLHAAPVLRGQFRGAGVQPIQDLVPLHGVAVTLAVPREVKSVKLVPLGEALQFSQESGRIAFEVPEVIGHQMIEVQY